MKKLFVLVAVAAMATSAFAFDFMKSSKAVKNGDILAHVGIGYYPYVTLKSDDTYVIPPISAAVDYMLPIELPISVGGLISYSGAGYSYSYTDSDGTMKTETKISNLVVGVRANWHFDIGIDKIDAYSGILLGIDKLGSTITYSPQEYSDLDEDYGTTGLAYGVQAGINYFINPKLAIFVEGGYGPAFFSVGATMKF